MWHNYVVRVATTTQEAPSSVSNNTVIIGYFAHFNAKITFSFTWEGAHPTPWCYNLSYTLPLSVAIIIDTCSWYTHRY